MSLYKCFAVDASQSTLKIMWVCVILLHVQHKAVAKNVHTLIQTNTNGGGLKHRCAENEVISHFLIILLAFLHVQKEACYSSGYVVLVALSLVCMLPLSAHPFLYITSVHIQKRIGDSKWKNTSDTYTHTTLIWTRAATSWDSISH